MAKIILIAILILGLSACVTNPQNAAERTNLTHGAVKSQIKKGKTSQMEVIKLLGSPNITSKNKNGLEVWTYSKTASSNKSSTAAGGFLFFGASKAVDTNSVSTFDLIITFNNNDVVEDYAIVSSKF